MIIRNTFTKLQNCPRERVENRWQVGILTYPQPITRDIEPNSTVANCEKAPEVWHGTLRKIYGLQMCKSVNEEVSVTFFESLYYCIIMK